MKTSLSHLPEIKQAEILKILEIIKEEAKPEKVILFGSHARGDWVEDEYVENGTTFSYISDYDFLVVVKKGERKEHEIISHIENRSTHFRNVVSPIVHDIDYINEGLSLGQYFFTDIISEGIVLFDSSHFTFAKPRILTQEEQEQQGREYFDLWFTKASNFLEIVDFCVAKKDLRSAAFLLHQAAESLYATILLVFTGYKPKTHNVQKLREYSKHVSLELFAIFQSESEEDFYLLKILKRAYIDARYKAQYELNETDLNTLLGKVKLMGKIVETLCVEKIG